MGSGLEWSASGLRLEGRRLLGQEAEYDDSGDQVKPQIHEQWELVLLKRAGDDDRYTKPPGGPSGVFPTEDAARTAAVEWKAEDPSRADVPIDFIT